MTDTPLLVLHSWLSAGQCAMTIAVLPACIASPPSHFLLAATNLWSCTWKNWYLTSPWTPSVMNAEKSLLLKHLAIPAAWDGVNWARARKNGIIFHKLSGLQEDLRRLEAASNQCRAPLLQRKFKMPYFATCTFNNFCEGFDFPETPCQIFRPTNNSLPPPVPS